MAKRNNSRFFKVGIWVIGVIFAAGSIYAAFHYRLGAVESDVNYIKTEEIPKLDETRMEVVGIKKDIEHLGEKVDRNFTVQQQILVEIKDLRR